MGKKTRRNGGGFLTDFLKGNPNKSLVDQIWNKYEVMFDEIGKIVKRAEQDLQKRKERHREDSTKIDSDIETLQLIEKTNQEAKELLESRLGVPKIENVPNEGKPVTTEAITIPPESAPTMSGKVEEPEMEPVAPMSTPDMNPTLNPAPNPTLNPTMNPVPNPTMNPVPNPDPTNPIPQVQDKPGPAAQDDRQEVLAILDEFKATGVIKDEDYNKYKNMSMRELEQALGDSSSSHGGSRRVRRAKINRTQRI